MSGEERVALDSNCYTYFIDVHRTGPQVTQQALSDEKIALIRTYIYSPRMEAFYLPRRVADEFGAIADTGKKENHQSWDVLFAPINEIDEVLVQERASALRELATRHGKHAREADSVILAQCEQGGIDVLLSNDHRFHGFLKQQARDVRIMYPTAYWTELEIPRGATPKRQPHPTNPLTGQAWWRWE